MAMISSQPPVGTMLREWRERRRRTQLDLALDARISARHLSFVETGRSRPGAEVILRLAEQLELPFRERNALLLAAGHAPAFPDRPLEHPEMAATRAALEVILANHEPFPALVVDRHWNIVMANRAIAVLASMIDPALLVAPVNAMRAGLHPRGLAARIVNLGVVRAYFLARLRQQASITADPVLAELVAEVSAYPAPPGSEYQGGDPNPEGAGAVPFILRSPDGEELTLFGIYATFDTPFDVATSELAIELAYPADAYTAQVLTRIGA
jgi:transcriptional regulator with XRE-family HTH domain